MKNFNGICYQPFPPGYDASTANSSWIFFGSDIAYDPMTPLWGSSYTSSTGSSCNLNGPGKARNDIKTLADMGVNLIRLYDWEPRNKHLNFLDYCLQHNIKVLAPVSNFFLKKGLPQMKTHIPSLIDSFSNADKTDYHPAIEAIIIGNEPALNGFTVDACVQFTKAWAEIEKNRYPQYRELPVGHPVDFGTYGGQYPCFGFWDPLFSALNFVTDKNLNTRLFLAPQTYNGGNYLFENAEGSGKPYVELAYNKYKKPMLFTELGYSRFKNGYQQFIQDQLSGYKKYQPKNPEKLLGLCFFQFADKVWKQGTSEGMFGVFSHGNETLCTISYDAKDFTHWDEKTHNEPLRVDNLIPTPIYDILVKNYKN